VNFEPIGDNKTRITLRMDYEPEDVLDKVGDWLGVFSSRVEGDLQRFKEFIESRGQETGAWRGKVEQGRPQPGA